MRQGVNPCLTIFYKKMNWAAIYGRNGDTESGHGWPRRGRETEAAAEPLRAEKGVMQPNMAATWTKRHIADVRIVLVPVG